ncbi:MAG: PorT family protein [Bacteroidetes bacterium]|nr:PorT family protein [Bacteroidota bacterium]MBP7398542.1 PorT family protein [Chitinophagales bacterium]MBK7109467.1 PorT family protein [Bacteroidota bacterium]MBK8487794.1 PorT family protein [Bacteroidota bacterium]MBK8682451.1 PorT family protein [Bacteroidota bacterium]
MKKVFLLFCISISACIAQGQVIISLLLGDLLNTGKIEFGLDGGANFSALNGLNGSKSITGFHLGFYFDFKLENNWMIHTGVIVKSPLGANGINPYSVNDALLDSAFIGGEVSRNLRYFNVPVLAKYMLPSHFYAEAGIQLGLMNKAFDEFTQEVNEPEDLKYKLDIEKQYHPLDAGIVAGIGYRMLKGNGMNLSVRYYYGMIDIKIDDSEPDVFNRSLYLAVGIPIGATKAKEKRGE